MNLLSLSALAWLVVTVALCWCCYRLGNVVGAAAMLEACTKRPEMCGSTQQIPGCTAVPRPQVLPWDFQRNSAEVGERDAG